MKEEELGQLFIEHAEHRAGTTTDTDTIEQTLSVVKRQLATRDLVALFAGSIFALLLGLCAVLFVRRPTNR